MLMFDCTFTGRGRNSTVIRFRRTDTENLVSCNNLANSGYYKLISSNNLITDARLQKSDGRVKVYEIPAGKAEELSTELTPETSFLKTEAVTAAWTDKPAHRRHAGKDFRREA